MLWKMTHDSLEKEGLSFPFHGLFQMTGMSVCVGHKRGRQEEKTQKTRKTVLCLRSQQIKMFFAINRLNKI